MAFLKQFPDDDACWSHLERVRWPDGPICPKCGNLGPTRKCGRAHYHLCKACNAKFTVAMGTPLEGTHLPMRTWFTALYLLAVSSKGLSSVALGRHLGIGQKTAWFLGHRIRALMADETGLVRGIVEADETSIGGKRKRGQKSKRDGDGDQPKGRGGSRKAMVVTAVGRGGKARAKRGGTHSERTIASFLSPNTAESWNATFTRAINGVWHWISIKHLDRSCTETAFRWNHRDHDARRSTLLGGNVGRVPWKVLTA